MRTGGLVMGILCLMAKVESRISILGKPPVRVSCLSSGAEDSMQIRCATTSSIVSLQ